MYMETNTLWEEKSYIEPEKNCSKCLELGRNDFMKNTKNDSMSNTCKGTGKTKKKLREDMTDLELLNDTINFLYKKIYLKNWIKNNKEKHTLYQKEYNKKHHKTKKYKEYKRKYEMENKYKEYRRKYNKTAHRQDYHKKYFSSEKHKGRMRDKMRNNPEFRIKTLCRQRIRRAIKSQGVEKSKRTSELLGCTSLEFYNHIVNKFTSDMTIEALMSGEIHIDHIKPCSSFNLLDPEQQKECFHYTNCQPLWAKDNLSKRDKY